MADLNLALIGLGKFGRNYLRLLQEIPGVVLKYVVKHDPDFFGVTERLNQNVIKTTDLQTVFSDKTIDAIVIATPPSTHFSLCHQAVTAGKHVLVEKPMVIS